MGASFRSASAMSTFLIFFSFFKSLFTEKNLLFVNNMRLSIQVLNCSNFLFPELDKIMEMESGE